MQVFSSMTAEEEYRLTGTVTGERLEKLLDCALLVENLDSVAGCIREASTYYPDDDFLYDTIRDMTRLTRKIKGANKDELFAIVQRLSLIAQNTAVSAELGIEELDSALDYIKELT